MTKFKIIQDPIIKLDSNKVQSVLREFLMEQIPKDKDAKEIKPKFPMDFILFKFPNLKKVLTELLTVTFKDYIDNIYVMAPKPTTFKVVLRNKQWFNIIYNERSYIVKVEGKKYYLLNIGEKENAIEKIANLLNSKKFITSKSEEEEEKEDKKESKSKKKSSGGSSGGGSSSSKDEPLPDIDSLLGDETSEEPAKEDDKKDSKEDKPEEEPLAENIKFRLVNEIQIDISGIEQLKKKFQTIKRIPERIQDPVLKHQINKLVKSFLNQGRYNLDDAWVIDQITRKEDYRKEVYNYLNKIYKEIVNLIDTGAVDPISKSLVNTPGNAKAINLRIGKYDVDKGEAGNEFPWEEAVGDAGIISAPTKKRCLKIFNKLGIKPSKVYTASKPLQNKSTYVLGYYGDEPILCVQRQTSSAAAGQFYLYSKYKKSGKAARLGTDYDHIGYADDDKTTKEDILNFLKIPNNEKDQNI